MLQADAGLYRISALKHEPKDFSYRELRQEVGRRKFFQPLYEFGQTFLGSAGLSNESVKYYASLVQFYTAYKLQRMAAPTTRLYLLCFAYHRFRQINANAIIYYNTLLLSRVYEQKRAAGDQAAMDIVKGISPNAWRHVNLFGRIEFTEAGSKGRYGGAGSAL